MVAVAQLVESRIVIPVVAGSSPVSHPNKFKAFADSTYQNLKNKIIFLGGFFIFTSYHPRTHCANNNPPKKVSVKSRIFLNVILRKLYMKTSLFTESQIIHILKLAEAGTPFLELCRRHGMSSASLYKCRSKYGGMDASMMTRMKELEKENRRLKKMYAEEKLKAQIISEAMQKSDEVISPT